MAYTSLALVNFRSYASFEATFSPGVTMIVGSNGSGKTNLLEALYVLSQGASFRVGDKDLVRFGTTGFGLRGTYDDHQRQASFEIERTPPKTFMVDGQKRQRLGYQQKVPLVLFEPSELRLLSGSPKGRRDYIDTLVGRLWPDGSRVASRFERALLQRNNIIKQAAERPLTQLEDQLFVWDIKLAEYAADLVQLRLAVMQQWNERLADLYSQLAKRPSEVTVQYVSETQAENYKAALLKQLLVRRAEDIARGFTSVGPHRDDFAIILGGLSAAVSASRGEVRTLVLGLKIIELQLLAASHQQAAARPLLLLDDVFSELDTRRRRALAAFTNQFQTVITTTEADAVAGYFAAGQIIDVGKSAT